MSFLEYLFGVSEMEKDSDRRWAKCLEDVAAIRTERDQLRLECECGRKLIADLEADLKQVKFLLSVEKSGHADTNRAVTSLLKERDELTKKRNDEATAFKKNQDWASGILDGNHKCIDELRAEIETLKAAVDVGDAVRKGAERYVVLRREIAGTNLDPVLPYGRATIYQTSAFCYVRQSNNQCADFDAAVDDLLQYWPANEAPLESP